MYSHRYAIQYNLKDKVAICEKHEWEKRRREGDNSLRFFFSPAVYIICIHVALHKCFQSSVGLYRLQTVLLLVVALMVLCVCYCRRFQIVLVRKNVKMDDRRRIKVIGKLEQQMLQKKQVNKNS